MRGDIVFVFIRVFVNFEPKMFDLFHIKGWLPSAKLKPTFTFLVRDFAIFNTFSLVNFSITLLGKGSKTLPEAQRTQGIDSIS